MPPIALFGIQFTLALVAYALIAWWYVSPRLAGLRPESALVPLVWVHAFRIIGGAFLVSWPGVFSLPGVFLTMLRVGLISSAGLVLQAPLSPRLPGCLGLSSLWVWS